METDMTGRIPARAAKLAAALLAATAVLAVAAGTASAEVIYNNVPSPLPGNLPSVSFGAASTSEFGGQVKFQGTDRATPKVTVVMSSWACQYGNWYDETCETPKTSQKFDWPIKLKVYEVGLGNSVGPEIASAEKAFKMPYRPTEAKAKCNKKGVCTPALCAEGTWYEKYTEQCFHGKAFRISFTLKSTSKVRHAPKLKLPENAIISVSYNTTDSGPKPVGEQPCNKTTAGCFYDSLNVALAETPSLTVGSDPTEDLYVNSTDNEMYCGSSATLGTFGPTGICSNSEWDQGEQPAIGVSSSLP
jgi:hypothetical protein